jgi:hypothetical protein
VLALKDVSSLVGLALQLDDAIVGLRKLVPQSSELGGVLAPLRRKRGPHLADDATQRRHDTRGDG